MRLAARYGCSAFISKPFEPEEFLRVIRGLLPDIGNGAPYTTN
jgi:hypothetical protein